MPELPEVETVARQLHRDLRGRVLRRLETLDPKLRVGRADRVSGRRVRRVCRAGKQVAIELAPRAAAEETLWIGIHLGMTGRLLWYREEPGGTGRHLRARLTLDAGVVLFIDPRRFGSVRIVHSCEQLGRGGRDPVARGFTPAVLGELLQGNRQEIKVWLMRQDRVAGIGNIYASEILFAAQINPRRAAGLLSEREIAALHSATRAILRRAIRRAGTTFSDFQDSRGRAGSYQKCLAVYGREGEACLRCGEAVWRFVQQGRSTFFCPACQAGTAPTPGKRGHV
jgi:formamidopyrimidine-DNA glycosylase